MGSEMCIRDRPRTAPSSTKEHRITLGNYEREQLSAMVERANEDKDDQFLIESMRILAGPVAGAASAYMLYQGMVGWGEGRNRIAEWWRNLTSPDTGPTASDVPRATVGVIDSFFTFVFGPLGYEGSGTFSDDSQVGDMWSAPDGGGGGGF